MTLARRVLPAALAAVALAMLLITLVPAEIWRHPATDASYSGFDPNLVYASGGDAGSVRVTREAISMTSGRSSFATVNLVTTPLGRLKGALRVIVESNTDAPAPFRVGFWDPESGVGYFVHFGQAPNDYITVEGLTGGTTDRTLLDGDVVSSSYVGTYALGTPYRIEFALDRPAGRLSFRITDEAAGATHTASIDSRTFPAIFDSARLSLTVSTEGGADPASVSLSDWRLAFPHQRSWAVRITDPTATALMVALGAAGAVVLLAALLPAVARLRRHTHLRLPPPGARLVAVAAASAVYVAGNALLFPLGGHPFDMGDEKLYAYVTHTYGITQLFYLPNTVSLAGVWGGIPYVEFAFPYPPPMGYLSWAIGMANSVLFAGGGAFKLDSVSLEYLIKSVNVGFGLADAGLIFLVLRRMGVSEKWSAAGAATFLFNPAVWFSMSVWGQTHVISVFFILLAILMAELELPTGAWLSLGVACLTRPQMLVFGLVLGAVFVRRFGWRQNVRGISITVIAASLAILPLALQTSPSLPVDIMFNNLRTQEGPGAAFAPVSQDAYSLWPLVTYVTAGASGPSRAFTASSDVLVGPLTYQRAGQILTGLMLLLVLAAIIRRRREGLDHGAYVPLVAFAIVSFLMFLTGTVATHFLLALPLLLLCRPWMTGVGYGYIAAAWTVTAFVAMFGDMGSFLSAQYYPLLAPSRNAVTAFFVNLYGSDRFITVAIVANLCAVVWVGVTAFRGGRTALETKSSEEPAPVWS